LINDHVFRSERGRKRRAEIGSVYTRRGEGSRSRFVEAGRSERSTLKSLSEAIAASGSSVDLSGDFQVFWKSFNVFESLNFLASETRLASMEVVVQTLSTNPAVLRELETLVSPLGLFHPRLFALDHLFLFSFLFLSLFGVEWDESQNFRGRFFSFNVFNLLGFRKLLLSK
jgi:hypothetical protein